MRGWLVVFLLLPQALFAADAWSLETLMAKFAAEAERSASYREEQYMSMLEIPLESSGTLTFRAPDFVEKRVDNDGGSFRVVGNELQLEQGGERRSLSLDNTPALAAFVASFRATLGGDLASLQKFYDTHLEGSARAWTLTLKPKQSEMAAVVKEIRISGSASEVHEIFTQERGGDYSRMVLREGNGE